MQKPRWKLVKQVTMSFLLACFLIVALPRIALANAGFPAFFLYYSYGAALFLPLLGLEIVIARRILKEKWHVCVGAVVLANVYSTVFGIVAAILYGMLVKPILGSVLYAILPDEGNSIWLAAVVYAPWFPAFLDGKDWTMPLAIGAWCVPLFFLSVWVERFSANMVVSKDARPRVGRWAWTANLWSYGVMEAVIAAIGIMLVIT